MASFGTTPDVASVVTLTEVTLGAANAPNTSVPDVARATETDHRSDVPMPGSEPDGHVTEDPSKDVAWHPDKARHPSSSVQSCTNESLAELGANTSASAARPRHEPVIVSDWPPLVWSGNGPTTAETTGPANATAVPSAALVSPLICVVGTVTASQKTSCDPAPPAVMLQSSCVLVPAPDVTAQSDVEKTGGAGSPTLTVRRYDSTNAAACDALAGCFNPKSVPVSRTLVGADPSHRSSAPPGPTPEPDTTEALVTLTSLRLFTFTTNVPAAVSPNESVTTTVSV